MNEVQMRIKVVLVDKTAVLANVTSLITEVVDKRRRIGATYSMAIN